MEQSVKERIIMFIKRIGISQSKFEKSVGLSNGYLNQLRNSPSYEKIQSIISAYPELNQNWLLTGKGPMLKDNSSVIVGGNVIGDHSRQEIGDTVVNGSLNTESSLRMENEHLKKEVDLLRKLLDEKERIIGLLTNGKL